MAGCQKEATSSEKTSELNESQALELKVYQEFSAKPNAERVEFYARMRELLNGGLKKSTSEQTLEETFIGIEGLLNSAFYQDWDEFEEMQVESKTVDLNYYEDNGVKMVSFQEFNRVYSELYNAVSNELDPVNDEEFLMIDMTIQAIDESANTVTIGAGVYLANLSTLGGAPYFTPSGPYYAALGAGPCDGTPNPTPGGTDAATFIKSYANATADWRSTSCPNGRIFAPIGVMFSYNSSLSGSVFTTDPNSNTNTWQAVINSYWKSNTNDCLGYDNEEWYGLYNKIDGLVNYGEVRAQTLNVDAEFELTDYHSDKQGPGSYNPDISQTYYHGGIFAYSLITCQ